MASTSHSTDQSASGFEGCEKNLKIEFHPRADLRSITRKEWDAILDDARCTIISERHNEHFNSYVLSESSLFVFPNRMILKTCGTTFLLNCLPALLRAATRIGTEPVFVQFSRSNFMFPNKQPVTHRNFSLEVKYLNTFFKSGQAYVLGPLNGPRWHLYIANMQDKPERRDPTFEMVMFDLDEAKMRQFFKSTDPSDGLAEDGPGATTLSGIDKIIPNADIDSFLFSPCGYSCNALIGPYYFTIHITPEPLCSFVSFETNVPVKDYNALVQTVADTFKPGSFAVSLLVDQHADSYNLVEKKLHGYKERASTFQKFEGAYNITCGQFLAEGRAPNPKYLHEAKEKEEPLEDEDTGKFVVSYSSARELDAVRLRALAVAAVEEIRPVASIQDDEDCSCTVARLVDHEEPDQALCVVDLDQLVARFQRWCELFPRVRPLYNVKCNNDVGVIRALNAFGCGFSCGSASEMKHVLSQGVKPSRLLFCAPYMQQSQLRFAQQHRTGLIAFHSLPTLESMVKHAPNTELLVRLCGASLISKQSNFVQSHEHLHHAHHSGQKLGVSLKDVPALLAAAKALDAKVVGVTLSLEANASIRSLDDFRAGLNGCRQVFDMAAKILGYELSVVDIGGGFPDGTSGSFDMEELASELNADLTRLFPEPVRVMARPSRFLVTSSHKVAVSVIARREVAVGREQEEPVAASSSTPLPLHDSVSIKSLASTDEDKSPRSTSSGSPPHSRSTTPPPGSSSAVYTAHEREMALLREASDDEDSLRLSSSKLESGEAGSDRGFLYYVNDGLLAYLLYGDKRPLVPKVLETTSFKQRKSLAKDHKCAIFGPDSECMDPIVPHGQLPELHMGDWLLFENMGTCPLASPGVALACDPPLVRYVTRG